MTLGAVAAVAFAFTAVMLRVDDLGSAILKGALDARRLDILVGTADDRVDCILGCLAALKRATRRVDDRPFNDVLVLDLGEETRAFLGGVFVATFLFSRATRFDFGEETCACL